MLWGRTLRVSLCSSHKPQPCAGDAAASELRGILPYLQPTLQTRRVPNAAAPWGAGEMAKRASLSPREAPCCNAELCSEPALCTAIHYFWLHFLGKPFSGLCNSARQCHALLPRNRPVKARAAGACTSGQRSSSRNSYRGSGRVVSPPSRQCCSLCAVTGRIRSQHTAQGLFCHFFAAGCRLQHISPLVVMESPCAPTKKPSCYTSVAIATDQTK